MHVYTEHQNYFLSFFIGIYSFLKLFSDVILKGMLYIYQCTIPWTNLLCLPQENMYDIEGEILGQELKNFNPQERSWASSFSG